MHDSKNSVISAKKRTEMINETFQIKSHCFEFFFLGTCNKINCCQKHNPFENETELFHFVSDFKQQIMDNLSEEKKTDKLLKRYILENLATIFAQNLNPKKIKPSLKNSNSPNFNQNLEIFSETEFLVFHQTEINRELDFLQTMVEQSKIIKKEENNIN